MIKFEFIFLCFACFEGELSEFPFYVMLETDLKNSVIDRVEAYLVSTDQFLVEVSLLPHKAPNKIKVTIDGDVAIADCENLNRLLLKQLTDHDAGVAKKYGLEVSTPGLDSPLKLIRQYEKNKGRCLRVLMKSGRRVEGVLENITKNAICLRQPAIEENMPILFSEIEKAFVQVSFK